MISSRSPGVTAVQSTVRIACKRRFLLFLQSSFTTNRPLLSDNTPILVRLYTFLWIQCCSLHCELEDSGLLLQFNQLGLRPNFTCSKSSQARSAFLFFYIRGLSVRVLYFLSVFCLLYYFYEALWKTAM